MVVSSFNILGRAPSPEFMTTPQQYSTYVKGDRRSEVEIIFDLKERLERREEEFRAMAQLNEELLKSNNELEIGNSELKETVESLQDTVAEQQCLLVEQEEKFASIDRYNSEREDEINEQLDMMRRKLKIATQTKNNVLDGMDEKDQQIISLETMVDHLTNEVGHYKEEQKEARTLLIRMQGRVEEFRFSSQKRDRFLDEQEEALRFLSRDNEKLVQRQLELQTTVDAQNLLLEQRDEEIVCLDKYCHQREQEIKDDMDRMRMRLKKAVKSRHFALAEDDEQIQQLAMEVDHYESVAIEQMRLIRIKEQKINNFEVREIEEKRKAAVNERELVALREENAKMRAQVERRETGSYFERACGNAADEFSDDLEAISRYMKQK